MTPKDGNGQPLKPVDPTDPTKGYIIPDIPQDPTQSTPINYVKDTQKAKTTFVDEKGNPIPGVAEITEEGDSDTPLTKESEVKAKIKELENKGYELVSNTYPEGGKFDTDKDTDQEFKVTLKQKEVTVFYPRLNYLELIGLNLVAASNLNSLLRFFQMDY